MKYTLFIYMNEADWAGMTEAEQARVYGAFSTLTEDLKRRGQYVAGEELQPTATASTVRLRNGRTLVKTGVGAGTSILDIGCASCLYCEMAERLGAQVSGLDVAEPLLDLARECIPQGDFWIGEMEELPFADQTFDMVTGFNSFQFATNHMNSLKEARRVCRTGGSVVIGVWGKYDDIEAAGYFAAIGSFLPPPPPGAPGPFALSQDGALEALAESAGMIPGKVDEVDCPWEYPDDATSLRGLLAAGPALRAIRAPLRS